VLDSSDLHTRPARCRHDHHSSRTRSRCKTFQPGECLFDDLGALAEGQADIAVTGRRAVKDAARDGDYTHGSGQLPTELNGVAVDVDGREVSALRADHVEALCREPTAELVALVLKAHTDGVVVRRLLFEGAGDGPAGTGRRSRM